MSILKKMADMRWDAPRHCRVTKWRLTYREAHELANELVTDYHGLNSIQSPADIVGMMKDGTARMWDIPVEIKSAQERVTG